VGIQGSGLSDYTDNGKRWLACVWSALAAAILNGCAEPARDLGPLPDVPAGATDDGDVPPPDIPQTYVAPAGWDKYPWGTPLSVIEAERPDLQLLNAKTVKWNGKARDVHVECVSFDKMGNCTRANIGQDMEGGGAEAFGEYVDLGIGMKDAKTGAFLYPAILEFYAHYGASIGKTLHKDLKFCGIRLVYFSQPVAEDSDEKANDERVLQFLVRNYGFPNRYHRWPRITVESMDGQTKIRSKHKPKFIDYRWGYGPGEHATIVNTFHPGTRYGLVLIATSDVYEYAEAAHELGDVNNLWYRLLHDGLNVHEFEPHGGIADMDLDARPESSPMDKRTRAMFEPHHAGG
jgi:hypothetical protein